MMNIKAHGNEENYGLDRISNLPDDARTHILSFLSTREAVQTCILSKRWINTWAFVPDLKFDIKEFVDDEMDVEFETKFELITKFELLVKSVLEKRETLCVNRFQLYLWLDPYFYWPRTQAVANCVGDVMKLEPRECLVKLCSSKKLNLNTDFIFTCASLIYLQLCLSTNGSTFVAKEPNSVNLPCLKTLNLDGVTMSDDSFQKLLLGCPVLEELVLESFYIDIIEICSSTLKKLVLHMDYEQYFITRLLISTPNLLNLNIEFLNIRETLLLNTPSLVDASIFIEGWHSKDKYVTRISKLIHSLSNVESLLLDLDCLKRKVMKEDVSSCPVFNNLKYFEVVLSCLCDFDLALYFLHHSPKLQKLTLQIYPLVHTSSTDDLVTIIGPDYVKERAEYEPNFSHHHINSSEFGVKAGFCIGCTMGSCSICKIGLESCRGIYGRTSLTFVREFLEEPTQEGTRTRDALVQREFLKTVRIVGYKTYNGFIDQLIINILLTHVKIIGEIIV